jgi:hypothetical protein
LESARIATRLVTKKLKRCADGPSPLGRASAAASLRGAPPSTTAPSLPSPRDASVMAPPAPPELEVPPPPVLPPVPATPLVPPLPPVEVLLDVLVAPLLPPAPVDEVEVPTGAPPDADELLVALLVAPPDPVRVPVDVESSAGLHAGAMSEKAPSAVNEHATTKEVGARVISGRAPFEGLEGATLKRHACDSRTPQRRESWHARALSSSADHYPGEAIGRSSRFERQLRGRVRYFRKAINSSTGSGK